MFGYSPFHTYCGADFSRHLWKKNQQVDVKMIRSEKNAQNQNSYFKQSWNEFLLIIGHLNLNKLATIRFVTHYMDDVSIFAWAFITATCNRKRSSLLSQENKFITKTLTEKYICNLYCSLKNFVIEKWTFVNLNNIIWWQLYKLRNGLINT